MKVTRKATRKRNLATGLMIEVPAKDVVVLKRPIKKKRYYDEEPVTEKAIEQKEICYSPWPPTDYAVSNGEIKSGYGARAQLTGDLAIWNLLWISGAEVDDMLTWPPEHVMHAPLCTPLSRACMETAEQLLGTEPIRKLVTPLPPVHLGAPRKKKKRLTKPLSLHKLLGAEWFRRVEKRAAEYRGTVASNGKVLQVSFARRPRKLS